MKKFNVGVIGATGMVGQRFMLLLNEHPWFNVVVLAASARSAGKTYKNAVGDKWAFECPIPEKYCDMVVLDAEADMQKIAASVDFVFCAVNMDKAKIRALEEAYAKMEVPVVSNNSAHRFTADVPMVIPEINPEHVEVISAQRARLGTKRGFIAVKSNCSLQSYVPLLHPLKKFGVKEAAIVSFIRVFIVALLFGNVMTLAYSCAGALLSIVLMAILKKLNSFSVVGTSIIGGVAHNLGQILVAMFVFDTVQIGYYMAVLAVTGTLAGVVIGLLGAFLLKRIPQNKIL